MPPNLPENIIPIPSLELHKNLSLEQDLANLAQVEAQFRKICSLLDQRLNTIKGKLININDRIGKSKQKVEAIKNINEAITIISPSKFVKTYKKGQDLIYHQRIDTEFVNNPSIPSLDYEEKVTLNPNGYLRPVKEDSQSSSSTKSNTEFIDLLKLTKSTLKNKREMFEGDLAVQNLKYQGLGRVPRNIKYIDSLLVFNSNKNPYKKYSSFDNLVTNSHLNLPKKKIAEEKDKINLAEAPKTLIEGDMLQTYGTQDYKFRPKTKDLPQINAPAQLGLKGIVNMNLANFDTDSGPSERELVRKPTLPDPKLPNEEQTIGQVPYGYSRQASMPVSTNTTNTNQPTLTQPTNTSYTPVLSQPQLSTINPPTNTTNTVVVNSSNLQPPSLNLPPPNINLPPPNINLSQPNTNSNLPPPKIDLPPPNLNLPPPNLNLPPPNLNLPPPNVNLPKPGDPNAGNDIRNLPPITNDRARLLDEIRNPNPMARLRKATKVERPPIERQTKGKPDPKASHMDYLKQQIQLRFAALNKGKKKAESSDSEDSD